MRKLFDHNFMAAPDGRGVAIGYLALLLLVILPSTLFAADYYVSPTGSGTTCSLVSPCALSRANTNAVAGDTVYLTAGAYTTSYIYPTNSGTSSARITYSKYASDVVSINNQAYVIRLNGNDYITVTGINGTNFTYGVSLDGTATNNIISYGTFGPSTSTSWIETNHLLGSSQYNWIHHCTFYGGGFMSADDDIGCVFNLGYYDSDLLYNPYYVYYNLIEDCTFYNGGHHVFGMGGRYNTVRNNYFRNYVWSNGYGNRVIFFNGYTNPAGGGTGENLWEGNKMAYSSISIDNGVVSNTPVCTPYNILRYNELYHNYGEAITFYGYSPTMWQVAKGANNSVYNNTFFNNGYAISGGSHDAAVYFQQPGYAINNKLKNNLYYSHYQVYSGTTSDQIFANEFNGDVSGNPLFVNASTTPPADKTDSTLPDLDLQSGSPAINAGGALTTVAVADAGSGTALYVSDARYFQYGQWAPAGTVSADWIAVGTVSNPVQISSIDYATNIITLANTISRSDGDSVWLYKKSDGVQVLYGSAPDAGAYESGYIPPSIQGCTISGGTFK